MVMHEKELGVSEHGGVRDVDDGDGRTDGRTQRVFRLHSSGRRSEGERARSTPPSSASVRRPVRRSVRPSSSQEKEEQIRFSPSVRLSPFDGDARYAVSIADRTVGHIPRSWVREENKILER